MPLSESIRLGPGCPGRLADGLQGHIGGRQEAGKRLRAGIPGPNRKWTGSREVSVRLEFKQVLKINEMGILLEEAEEEAILNFECWILNVKTGQWAA